MINNQWYDRASGKQINCVQDSDSPVLKPESENSSAGSSSSSSGRSPRNLLAAALPDWIKEHSPESKVFTAGGKDRAAILTGGKTADAAFWYDDRQRAATWKKYRSPESQGVLDGFNWRTEGWSRYEQKLAIWCDLAIRGATEEEHGFWFGEGYRLLLEGRCVKCNKKLTKPESIRTGIGPVCAGR